MSAYRKYIQYFAVFFCILALAAPAQAGYKYYKLSEVFEAPDTNYGLLDFFMESGRYPLNATPGSGVLNFGMPHKFTQRGTYTREKTYTFGGVTVGAYRPALNVGGGAQCNYIVITDHDINWLNTVIKHYKSGNETFGEESIHPVAMAHLAARLKALNTKEAVIDSVMLSFVELILDDSDADNIDIAVFEKKISALEVKTGFWFPDDAGDISPKVEEIWSTSKEGATVASATSGFGTQSSETGTGQVASMSLLGTESETAQTSLAYSDTNLNYDIADDSAYVPGEPMDDSLAQAMDRLMSMFS